MDGLRLALLILGIAVVAVVYFWTSRRRRLEREAGEFDRFDAWTNQDLDPLAPPGADPKSGLADYDDVAVDADELTQPNLRLSAIRRALGRNSEEKSPIDEGEAEGFVAPAGAKSIPFDAMDDARGGDVQVDPSKEHSSALGVEPTAHAKAVNDLEAVADSLQARVAPQVGSLDDIELDSQPDGPVMSSPLKPTAKADGDPDGVQDAAEVVIVLNVMATADQSFDGPALKVALENAGLKAGDMQLYHYRTEAQSADSAPIFSALNAVKPGTLDVKEFDGMRTPGIAMVLRMHGIERPSEAFELMLGAARSIADELDGQVCDETRSTLTGQALNHMRERISAAAFRARSGS